MKTPSRLPTFRILALVLVLLAVMAGIIARDYSGQPAKVSGIEGRAPGGTHAGNPAGLPAIAGQSGEPGRPLATGLPAPVAATAPAPGPGHADKPARIAKQQRRDAARQTPAVARWIATDGARSVPHVIALDEVVLRDEDGKDHLTPLAPAATTESLAARLAALASPGGVFPVAYPEGVARDAWSRRLVTSDIQVNMPADGAADLAAETGLVVKPQATCAPGWVVLAAENPLAALASLPMVRRDPTVAAADVLLAANRAKRAMPNDPLAGSQWHLKKTSASAVGTDVNIENAWNYGGSNGNRGNGIRIGVIDDGVQVNHPDLLANIDSANDKDWNGNDSDPSPGTGDDHGTACAGNAAARGNNSIGVSGTAPEATLVGMRLIAAAVTDAQEAQAMDYLNDIIQVKTNSWGPSDTGSLLEEPGIATQAAFANATATGRGGRGTIILFAGGNGGDVGDNSNYDGYANSIHTIAVGAFDSTGNRAYYSERGANLVICAPSDGASPALGITTVDRTGSLGYNTASSAAGGDYTSDFGGTSSATPTAAGIVALMLEKNPNLGWRDVQEILIRSAAKCRPTDGEWATNSAGFHFNHNFGAGLIDATAAVTMAGTWTNLATATSATATQSALSVAIPENNSAGITRTFALPASNLRVEHVTVKVDISHTARGNLAITLISPSGMTSNLAEVHGDTNNNYSAWKFSTVRHWGEPSDGTWSLKVADLSGNGNTTGGTLTGAELVIHGTPLAPVNPGPVVQLTAPADNAVFSPGATVTMQAGAVDFDENGAPGIVQLVEFLANGSVVASDTTAPYEGSFLPSLGSTTLSVRATDSQGVVGISSTRTITVVNQPPVIADATLSAGGQAYADTPLGITAVDAVDPEGTTVTMTYQWQSSANGIAFADEPGAVAAILPASPANSGKLWRCAITPHDDIQSGPVFVTATVNILDAPVTTASKGQPWSYTSGLVLRGTGADIARQAIISEVSQGPVGGTAEWIEILTLKDGSLAYWDLSDAAGNILLFLDDPVWDNIPAGTLIVVYNGTAAKDPLLPADDLDPADGRMVVSSTNPAYFDSGFDTWLPLGNSGDSIFLTDADSVAVHAIAYGNSSAASPNVGAVGSGKAAAFIGATDADADIAASWITGTALSARATRTAASPRVALSGGGYSQNFDATPGASGTSYPAGWTSYNITTADATMAVGNSTSTAGGNYNYGSRIGLLGSSSAFDPGALVLTLDNTLGATGLTISWNVIKVLEQSRGGSFKLQYSLTSATTGYVDVPGGDYAMGSIAQGTVTTFTGIALPAALENSSAPVYLRWYYVSSGSGSRDGIALDNVVISSSATTPTLTLSANPPAFAESAGPLASTGTLSVAQAPATAMTITLASSDAGEATVPASVILPAGQTSVTFAIAAIDEADADGPQSVTLTASAAGYTMGTIAITVNDDEPVLDGVTPAMANGGDNTGFVNALRSGALNLPALFRLGSGAEVPAGLSLDPNTGVLAGTIGTGVPAGPYTIIIERFNSLGEVVSQQFILTINPTGGFTPWIESFEGLPDTTATGDPDRDGLPNLIEYLLARLPGVADAPGAITHTATGSSISLTWRQDKAVTDATLVAEWSSDSDGSPPWQTGGIQLDVLEDNPGDQLKRATLPVLPGEPTRFLRLRAHWTP